jgi:hypothetical protein
MRHCGSRPRRRGWAGALLVLGAFALSARGAAAEDAKDPVAAARALFEQASEKLDRKEFAAACPLLEQALALTPAANGARLALAECYEGLGRRASAWKAYRTVAEAAGRLGQAERQKEAETKAETLKPQLGAVVVEVGPEARGLAGLTITACGEAVPESAFGKPLPMDRGDCAVTAAAPSRARWERSVTIADGATARVTIDHLEPAPGSAGAGAPAGKGAGDPGKGAANSAAPPLDRSHRGQVGAIARADIDVLNGGVVAAIGASYGASDRIELHLTGLLGKRGGFEVGATGYLSTGAVKPIIDLGAPALFQDGAYTGGRAAIGVEWDPNAHFGVFAAIGGAFFPDVPPGYAHALLLPVLGVQGRL